MPERVLFSSGNYAAMIMHFVITQFTFPFVASRGYGYWPPKKQSKPSRAALFYKRYFGINGIFYEQKTLGSQCATVGMQAAYKLRLVAAAARLGAARSLYWLYLGVLVLNTLVPSALLSMESKSARREIMALFDITCDLMYVILVPLSCAWVWGTKPLTPTGVGDFVSTMYPLVHILTTACAIERLVGVRPGAKLRKTIADAKHASSRRVLYVGVALMLLSYVLLIAFTKPGGADMYGATRSWTPTCGPCECERDGNSGKSPYMFDRFGSLADSGALIECSHTRTMKKAMVVLQEKTLSSNGGFVLRFWNLGITHIKPGAFRRLGGFGAIKHVRLSGNDLARIENGTFVGLDGVEELDLTDNKIERIDARALDGLASLTKLWLKGNPVTCADIASLAFSCEDQSSPQYN